MLITLQCTHKIQNFVLFIAVNHLAVVKNIESFSYLQLSFICFVVALFLIHEKVHSSVISLDHVSCFLANRINCTLKIAGRNVRHD